MFKGWILTLAANAIALLLAWLALDGFQLSFPLGFIVAVVAFGLINGLAMWLVTRVLRGRADRLMPAAGLIATLLALIVTTLVPDSLTIDGLSTWLWATLIVWIVPMLIWVLPGPWRSSQRPSQKS